MEDDKTLAQNVLFYFAVVFVLLYYLSPGVMLFDFFKRGNLKWKELPIAQTFGIIFNCLYWVITGSQQESPSDRLDTILYNSIGLSLGVISAIVIWYAGGKLQTRFLFLFMGFNVTFQISWYISLIDRGKLAQGKDGLVASIIASIFNVLMYVFSMQNIFAAWETRNYEKLPIASIGCGLFSTLFWMIYGIVAGQLYIYIPNAIGLVAMAVSLGIWVWFYITAERDNNQSFPTNKSSSVEIPSSEASAIIDQLLE